MIAETEAYKLLSKSPELNSLMDEIRGKKFPGGFKQGIFTYEIPEKPSDMRRKDLAPLIRINSIYESPYDYWDDLEQITEQRIVVNFWCETAKQADQLTNLIDGILKDGGFERYTSNELPRYKDSDIDLLMNVRKYRFFDWKK